MTDYYVVTSYNLSEFQRLVETMMKIGWICQGGVSVVTNGLSDQYYQAMIKEKK